MAQMDKRPLGHSGPPVSTLGLGTNNFGLMVDYEGARKIVHKSIDVGITFFDTADIYGGGLSEEYLGRALGSTRQEVVISTKVGITGRTTPPNASRS
jgi:aryl-alcohol dehydrogenase-like predicted oxidoreductase